MINIKEVDEEIKNLESKDYLTYDICNKLAMLYIVKNNYKPPKQQQQQNDNIEIDLSKSVK